MGQWWAAAAAPGPGRPSLGSCLSPSWAKRQLHLRGEPPRLWWEEEGEAEGRVLPANGVPLVRKARGFLETPAGNVHLHFLGQDWVLCPPPDGQGERPVMAYPNTG